MTGENRSSDSEIQVSAQIGPRIATTLDSSQQFRDLVQGSFSRPDVVAQTRQAEADDLHQRRLDAIKRIHLLDEMLATNPNPYMQFERGNAVEELRDITLESLDTNVGPDGTFSHQPTVEDGQVPLY